MTLSKITSNIRILQKDSKRTLLILQLITVKTRAKKHLYKSFHAVRLVNQTVQT